MSVHQKVIKKNFNRILKIKSVVSFQRIFKKLTFDLGSGGEGEGGRGEVTSKIQTYVFTVP